MGGFWKLKGLHVGPFAKHVDGNGSFWTAYIGEIQLMSMRDVFMSSS